MTTNTSSPKANLEADIRQLAKLINEYEEQQRLSSDPKERTRAKQNIAEQTTLIRGYLQKYVPLCRSLNVPMAQDITELVYIMGIEISNTAETSGVLVPAAPEGAFNPNQVDRHKLREEMIKAYPQTDFEYLCVELGERYDLLRGDTLKLKIAYLIEDAQDPLRYTRLVQKVITDHPHLKERLI